jgi:TBC1 domain family member 20
MDEFQQNGDLPGPHEPTENHQSKEQDDLQREKVERILLACREHDIDVLCDLATSCGGLVNDEIRRAACKLIQNHPFLPSRTNGSPGPILLGVGSTSASLLEGDGEAPWTALPPYHDEEQVQKDVDRSFVNYPRTRSDKELQQLRDELSTVILSVLRRHPNLRYFQGYHDIVQVLLLVLGQDASIPSVRRLSLLRIRDFMVGRDFSAAEPQLKIIPTILYSADRELYTHLIPTNPFYALQSTLTLYAHSIETYSDIARLFDYFLAQDATAPLYLFAAIIIHRRDELLELDPEEEADIVTFTIQKLPPNLDLDVLILRATKLKEAHPPERLPNGAWRRVSQYSVLKTTRDLEKLRVMTLEDGEILFDRHSEEVRRQQARLQLYRQWARTWKKHRRSVGTVSLTVGAVILAWWLGRNQDNPFLAHVPFKSFARDLWRQLTDGIPRRLL